MDQQNMMIKPAMKQPTIKQGTEQQAMPISTPLSTPLAVQLARTNDPIHEKLQELVQAVSLLPREGYGIFMRAWIAFQLKYNKVLVFEQKNDPKPGMIAIIDSLKKIALQARALHVGNVLPLAHIQDSASREDIEKFTHSLYGDCWVNFNPQQYDEATALLTERLTKNNVDLSLIKDKVVLDAGCGGGRYSIALARLGAQRVIGMDMGSKGLQFARQKARELGLNNVDFVQGNMLDLPFQDATFDFIFSNGVIHHTVDIEKALSEISRVIKLTGSAWIFVQGQGGYQWMITDTCREILQGVPREITQQAMILSGVPHNRVFYMMDHLYVPVQNWQTPQQFEAMMQQYGFTQYSRLWRGVNFDGCEKISQYEPFALEKYGHSELRYLASKKGNNSNTNNASNPSNTSKNGISQAAVSTTATSLTTASSTTAAPTTSSTAVSDIKNKEVLT